MPEKVKCTLVGVDGNAWSLMGRWESSARKQGWTPDEIKAVLDDAMAGNYDHLLAVLSSNCDGGGFGTDDEDA